MSGFEIRRRAFLEASLGLAAARHYLEDATPIDVAAKIGDIIGGFQAPPGFA